MCPFCLATAAVIAGSASGTGGVTAFIAGTILKGNKFKLPIRNKGNLFIQAEEVHHASNSDSDSNTEDRLSQ